MLAREVFIAKTAFVNVNQVVLANNAEMMDVEEAAELVLLVNIATLMENVLPLVQERLVLIIWENVEF